MMLEGFEDAGELFRRKALRERWVRLAPVLNKGNEGVNESCQAGRVSDGPRHDREGLRGVS